MKTYLLVFLTCTTIVLSSLSFSCGSRYDCGDEDSGCGNNNCTECQCADPGVGRNPCISDSTYCDVFGNIGSR